MSQAWIVGLALLVAVVELVYGKHLTDQSGENTGHVQMAISPLSWRCEIDLLEESGNRLESCDDWAMDEEEFHVFHGGACKIARADPDTHLPILESVTCDKGHWSATGTSIDFPNYRHKRWDWVPVVVGIACLLLCGGGGGDRREKKPPTFTFCPPSGKTYFTPSSQTSTSVTWTLPTATDIDGSIRSVLQVSGVSRGGSFEGSSSGRQHNILYVATDNDGLIANCHFSFTVKVRTCGALLWPANGYRDCTHDNILGSTCTYNCHEGYQLSEDAPVTCQSEDNPTWSTIPTCEKISCGTPPNVTNGEVDCAMGHNYGSYCVMSCTDGFDLEGQVFTRCEANREWFWGAPTTCIDDVPPKLACKKQQIFYAERGRLSKNVTWEEPTASDNIDPNPTITQTRGPDQGVIVEAGSSEYVTYTATDKEGNESPECTIELKVEAISCGHPLDLFDIDTSLWFDCNMGTYTYGDRCNVRCRLNLPLEGTDLITCKINDTGIGEPLGYWDWGNGSEPYCRDIACPAIDPPLNGALLFSWISNRPVTTWLCNKDYDIPDLGFNFNGMALCEDSGAWNPTFEKAPGCTKTFSSRGYTLPSEFFYYDGVCNEETILQAFKEILARINETFQALCPVGADCTAKEQEVTCGPIGRKKRFARVRRNSTNREKSVEAHHVQRRQTVDVAVLSFYIVVDFDARNMTNEQAYAYVDSIQLDLLKVAIQENLLNGAYLVPGWVYRDDSFQTADYGEPYCEPGSILVRNTKCNECPQGFRESGGHCHKCPVGEYAEMAGSVNCTTCPDGFSTRGEASEFIKNCTELCRPGSYSPDTFVPCAPCKAGYYQPLTGQSSCVSCPTAMSTKSVGSTSDADCQYFDAYLYAKEAQDPEAHVLEADIPLLHNFTLTFFTKKVSGAPDIPVIINIDDQLYVKLSETININTLSTNDVLGPSSQDDWVHVAVSWDSYGGLLTASYRGDLVVSHSSLQLSTVENGRLSITAGNTGVLISGFRLQDTVIGQASVDTSSSLCQAVDDADVLTMDIFKNDKATGVTVVVPTVCDSIDECLSSPCSSHGNCTNDIGSFTCTCFGKWTGETCSIPPNFCINNECSSGASCISGITNYTCVCPLGYTGVLCETPPVDGGWSEWSTWTECPVTCNTGTRTRSRACNSPEPDEYGQNCQGDDIETENCNTSPCPECPELKRGYGSILDCTTDIETGTQECTPKCREGYNQPPGLTIDKYTCGINTDYEWEPMKKVPPCVKPDRGEKYSFETRGQYGTSVDPAEEQSVKDAILSNANTTECHNSALCAVKVDISNGAGRRKRSTGSTVTVTFSIPITDTSDLQLEDYAANGTVSPGLQEIIDAINNLEATAIAINDSASSLFDVTTNGVTYSVVADTVTFNGSTSCGDGLIATNGLCAACPAGSYQNGDYCSFCDKGAYQDQVGQSSCLYCPYGYSTETIGSDNSNDCSVTVTTTTSTTTSTSVSNTTLSTQSSTLATSATQKPASTQSTTRTSSTTQMPVSTQSTTRTTSATLLPVSTQPPTRTSNTTQMPVSTQSTTTTSSSTQLPVSTQSTTRTSSSTQMPVSTQSTTRTTSATLLPVSTQSPTRTSNTTQMPVSTQSTTTTSSSTQLPVSTQTTTRTSTTTQKTDNNAGDGKKFIYIGVAIGVLMAVLICVALRFIVKHFSHRAKVSDSKADIRDSEGTGDSKTDARGIYNPIYGNPPDLVSAKQGPLDTRYSRGDTTLTVRDLDVEITPSNDSSMDLYN